MANKRHLKIPAVNKLQLLQSCLVWAGGILVSRPFDTHWSPLSAVQPSKQKHSYFWWMFISLPYGIKILLKLINCRFININCSAWGTAELTRLVPPGGLSPARWKHGRSACSSPTAHAALRQKNDFRTHSSHGSQQSLLAAFTDYNDSSPLHQQLNLIFLRNKDS